MNNITNIYTIARTAVQNTSARSAWMRGVIAYALDLIDQAEDAGTGLSRSELLNGAQSWSEYSCGGSALIYDQDIAARLCSPSELKKTRNGERAPNSRESWLDVQARALSQAARIIKRAERIIKYAKEA